MVKTLLRKMWLFLTDDDDLRIGSLLVKGFLGAGFVYFGLVFMASLG